MKYILTLSALASAVLAHGGVTGYKFGSTYVKGFTPYNDASKQKTIQRQWSTFNPIEQPNSPSMACNTPGTLAAESQSVAAGSQVQAQWNNGYSHDIGPIVVWMTECPSHACTPSAAKWFKIDESGLLSGTLPKGNWASGKMIKANYTWTFDIPKALKAGDYLLRTESIAMHSTAPQFYMECAQLKVTGSGMATPPANYRASIPGVYALSDPAWSQPVWARQQETSFKVPGPSVWKA
ncbi:glycoside hydrolase family 61 protein [Microthyrium microscopicum]|uniref:AA9 family lytic polysaccharide monooxygenase n=1 Tax=Microthyrium microscopicum TaxID=703497 RepID=A0A6A6U6K8_9PEZI|nr:glycoside hydrolase family 61 protein [Microthyrium microscopicum]